MTDSQHPNIDRLLEGTTPPITPWEQISEAIRTCVPDGDLGMVLRLMHDETRAQGERLAPELRAVLADNERLTRELDDLADFDKADERRQRLQDERDRAVKLWHEQHKEVERLTAQVAGARAVQAELDTELATAKRRLETSYQRSDQLADQLHQVVRELAAAGGLPLRRCDNPRPHSSHPWTASGDRVRCLGIEGDAEAELAETKAKLAAAEKELDHRRGIRPCWRALPHPKHLWLDEAVPNLCPGVQDAQPPAVAAPDAQDRAGRAQEPAGGPNVARDVAERGQEGPEGSKAPSGTTQAATEAPTPSGEPGANGGRR